MTALSVGIDVTHFFVYDVVMHLLMLHNLDPYTCYSINGVLLVAPATIAFAWLFFQFCEKPYMRKSTGAEGRSRRQGQVQEEEVLLESTVLASSEYRA
jgi:peptidoglycan/LPS O-acetylase OafA/YrhL